MENVSKEMLFDTFMKTADNLLTDTIPDYRRMGISRAIFDKLKKKQVKLYTTEVKRNNTIAWNLYQSIGFEIKRVLGRKTVDSGEMGRNRI